MAPAALWGVVPRTQLQLRLVASNGALHQNRFQARARIFALRGDTVTGPYAVRGGRQHLRSQSDGNLVSRETPETPLLEMGEGRWGRSRRVCGSKELRTGEGWNDGAVPFTSF